MSTVTEAAAPPEEPRTAAAPMTVEAPASGARSAGAQHVPLRRNKNFQLLWFGSSAAFIGLSVADICYPLVILAMTGSPLKAGLFATVQLIAWMLMTLPAGQLLDKHDRRRTLMIVELVRAVSVGAIALSWFLDTLTFWQLMGTAVVLGAAQAFAAARLLMIRNVVPTDQLTSALTQEQIRDHGSELVGPPLGGFLFGISRALPFVVAAAAMVTSFLCVFFVKLPPKEQSTSAPAPAAADGGQTSAPAPEDSAEDALGGGMLAGVRLVLRNPVMRATAITLTLINTVGFPMFLALIVLLQRQGESSTSIGVVMGLMAAGGLAGTVLVKPAHKRFQPGWLMIWACVVFTACIGAVVLVHTPFFVALFLFTANLVVPAAIVMIDILILRQVPDAQRGRVNAALQTMMGLGMPAGMLIGGAALQYLAPLTVLMWIAGGLATAALYALSQRALREARWPDDAKPAEAAA